MKNQAFKVKRLLLNDLEQLKKIAACIDTVGEMNPRDRREADQIFRNLYLYCRNIQKADRFEHSKHMQQYLHLDNLLKDIYENIDQTKGEPGKYFTPEPSIFLKDYE